MHIWVDADACPAVIKDILYRAAERTRRSMTLVANRILRTPASEYVRALQVPRGIDVADSHIVRELNAGDLVITADIPLAADVIAKGGHALNPRGEFYTAENIQERLALRNYLDELRGTGVRTGGPDALGNTDRKRFADQLDRFLTRQETSRRGAGPGSTRTSGSPIMSRSRSTKK
ncbi:MAG: YaiI/YqxD family protein [Burkholderiales bacterium]